MIGHSYLVVANRNKAKIFELKDYASNEDLLKYMKAAEKSA